MASTVLTFSHVFKTYREASGRELHALADVSFGVPPGRSISITGRSGSGKSTLLHLAAAIDQPSRGSVLLLDRDLGSLPDSERTLERRRHVGLVFQFFHLLSHLSVLDNVALPAMIAGDRREAYESRAMDLLERVELAGRAGDAVEKLSGGERQRVAICRALLRRPKLLLADEPTGNLDDENGRRVMDLLMQLAVEEKSSLIYVTHSHELASLAQESWRLHSGILETG